MRDWEIPNVNRTLCGSGSACTGRVSSSAFGADIGTSVVVLRGSTFGEL